MILANHISKEFNFTSDGTINQKCVQGPTDEEKELIQDLKEILHQNHGDYLKKRGINTFNFDTEKKGDSIVLKGFYVVRDAGEVEYVPIKRHRFKRKGHTSSNYFRKVGAFILPHGTPTFLQLYSEEMKESYEQIPLKMLLTGIITAISSFLGVELISLIVGLLIVAIIDLILGLVPGNVKKGQEKDHKIQAKLLAFSSNFLILLLFVKGGEYLRTFTKDASFFGFVADNIHYPIACWVFSIYFWRSIGYVARANKTKVPERIKNLFDKDVAS